jgi:hypothetical protein
LKVSKGIYLIFAIFLCIIKYQWFINQQKIVLKEENFFLWSIQNKSKKNLIIMAINQKILFF